MTHTHHIKSLALLSFLLVVITVGPILADAASPDREKIRACQYEARDRRWDALNEVRSDYYNERSALRAQQWEALGEISDWRWSEEKEDQYDKTKDFIKTYFRNQESILRLAYRDATSEVRSLYYEERRLCRKYGYIPVDPWDKFKGLEFELGPNIQINNSVVTPPDPPVIRNNSNAINPTIINPPVTPNLTQTPATNGTGSINPTIINGPSTNSGWQATIR